MILPLLQTSNKTTVPKAGKLMLTKYVEGRRGEKRSKHIRRLIICCAYSKLAFSFLSFWRQNFRDNKRKITAANVIAYPGCEPKTKRLALYLNSWNKLVASNCFPPFICNTHRPRNHWEIIRLLIQLRALCEVRQYLYLAEGPFDVWSPFSPYSAFHTPGFSIKGFAGALTVKDIRCWNINYKGKIFFSFPFMCRLINFSSDVKEDSRNHRL